MAIEDDTPISAIDSEQDICLALEILGGAALMQGNRRLYWHIKRAVVCYQRGDDVTPAADKLR